MQTQIGIGYRAADRGGWPERSDTWFPRLPAGRGASPALLAPPAGCSSARRALRNAFSWVGGAEPPCWRTPSRRVRPGLREKSRCVPAADGRRTTSGAARRAAGRHGSASGRLGVLRGATRRLASPGPRRESRPRRSARPGRGRDPGMHYMCTEQPVACTGRARRRRGTFGLDVPAAEACTTGRWTAAGRRRSPGPLAVPGALHRGDCWAGLRQFAARAKTAPRALMWCSSDVHARDTSLTSQWSDVLMECATYTNTPTVIR